MIAPPSGRPGALSDSATRFVSPPPARVTSQASLAPAARSPPPPVYRVMVERVPVPERAPQQRVPVPAPPSPARVPVPFVPTTSGGDDPFSSVEQQVAPHAAHRDLAPTTTSSTTSTFPERTVAIAVTKVRTPPPAAALPPPASQRAPSPVAAAPPKRTRGVAVIDDEDDEAFKSEDDEIGPLPAAPTRLIQPKSGGVPSQPASLTPADDASKSVVPAPTSLASPPKPRPKKQADGTLLQPEMDFSTEPFDVLYDREEQQRVAERETKRAHAPKVLSVKTLARLSQPKKSKPAPVTEQQESRHPSPPQQQQQHPVSLITDLPNGKEQAGPPKGVLAALTWNNLSASERANETHFYICLYALGLLHHLAVDKRTTMCSLCEFVRLPVGGTLTHKGKPVSPFATAVTLGFVAGADHVATLRFTTHVEEDEQLARDEIIALQIASFSNKVAYLFSLVSAQEPIPRHVFFDARDDFEDLTGDYAAYKKNWSPAIPYGPVDLVTYQAPADDFAVLQRSKVPSRAIFF